LQRVMDLNRWWLALPGVVRALVPGVALAGLGVLAFAEVLDNLIDRDDIFVIDRPVLDALASVRTPWLTTLMTWVTNAFGPVILPILVAAGCAIWAGVTRRWRDPALLVAAMVVSTGIAAIVKLIVARPRPPETLQVVPGFETSFSFPSGHTTGAATLVLVVSFLLWRRHHTWRALAGWLVASALIIALVGGTRLYLGYHFATDVIAGACLGVTTLGLVVAASRWLEWRDEARARASA